MLLGIISYATTQRTGVHIPVHGRHLYQRMNSERVAERPRNHSEGNDLHICEGLPSWCIIRDLVLYGLQCVWIQLVERGVMYWSVRRSFVFAEKTDRGLSAQAV